MLEANILEQLKSVFGSLVGDIGLHVLKSNHLKQKELLDMANDISSTSSRIKVVIEEELTNIPTLFLSYNNERMNFSFKGIPGGHEFSSLILAILNLDKKGRFPDAGIIGRIKKLNEMQLKTYVSLSCENCPEVVQSLNLISILNPKIEHQMIDGDLDIDEVSKLNLQGVPAVIMKDKMILSGKNSLGSILEKLESLSPESSDKKEGVNLGSFDVAVIGGGPAGVSSSIYLARKGFNVALITGNIGGQVRETQSIENMISIPLIEGSKLSSNLFSHLEEYPIQIFNNRMVDSIDRENMKIVLTSLEELTAKKIIVATGAKWRQLNVSGEKEYLGKGVAYCPHCDGPFYKGKDIAVIGGGNSGVEAALDLSKIVKSVILIEYSNELKADKILIDKLYDTPNISVLTGTKTKEVIGDGNKLTSILIERNEHEERLVIDGVFVQIGLVPNSQFIKNIVTVNKMGEIEVDGRGKTSVPNIFAAGDVTNSPFKQIIISMGDGAKVALSCFEELLKGS